jgi:hypothetical protein
MPQVTFDFPPIVFSALRKSPTEFAAERRLAAAIHWHSQEIASQGKAAEFAGLSRAQFRATTSGTSPKWKIANATSESTTTG